MSCRTFSEEKAATSINYKFNMSSLSSFFLLTSIPQTALQKKKTQKQIHALNSHAEQTTNAQKKCSFNSYSKKTKHYFNSHAEETFVSALISGLKGEWWRGGTQL